MEYGKTGWKKTVLRKNLELRFVLYRQAREANT